MCGCFCVCVCVSSCRRYSAVCAERLAQGEEAEADRRVVPAGRLVLGDRPQPAEVPRMPSGAQQEGR